MFNLFNPFEGIEDDLRQLSPIERIIFVLLTGGLFLAVILILDHFGLVRW